MVQAVKRAKISYQINNYQFPDPTMQTDVFDIFLTYHLAN